MAGFEQTPGRHIGTRVDADEFDGTDIARLRGTKRQRIVQPKVL
jgi:hypothetical protein